MSKYWVATVTRETLKLVRCEKCQCPFGYRMQRTVSEQAPAGWDEEKQKAELVKRAERKAKEVLRHECDPVPCPQCGDFQDDMVAAIREQEWGIAVPALGTLGFGAIAAVTVSYIGSIWWVLLAGATLVSLVSLLIALFRPRAKPNDPRGHYARLQLAGERAILTPDLDDIRQAETLIKEVGQAVYPELRAWLGNWRPPAHLMSDPEAARRAVRQIFLERVDAEPLPLWDEEKEQIADDLMAMAFPNSSTRDGRGPES
jgi:hypothetical protein